MKLFGNWVSFLILTRFYKDSDGLATPMENKTVTFCPGCLKPVEAKEYFADSIMPIGFVGATSDITCSRCGYSGFPLQASMEGYRKLVKQKKP